MIKDIKKIQMWYKVNELNRKGLNKSQIAREIGVYRGTVRKYLRMDEKAFEAWLNRSRVRPRKLAPYHEFIKRVLEQRPYLSAAQIEDRLKEHFPHLPKIHSKTIYNYSQRIRREHHLPKQVEKKQRVYQRVLECGYGE